MKNIKIVMADDHALVRAGIRVLAESIPHVEVAGEAINGRQAIELIESKKPDIALLDLAMPELNGIAVTELVARNYPFTRVIILSMHRGQEFVVNALRAGASGYLVKDAASSELADAIMTVAKGDAYLSPTISTPMVISSLRKGVCKREARVHGKLTARQEQVLKLMVEGSTTKEVAHELGLSIKTVEAHRAQLMDRLKIYDIPGLVRYAMRTGLTPPELALGE